MFTLFLGFGSLSCTQELLLDFPPAPKMLVANCIFSPDSVWRVRLTQPRSMSDTASLGVPVSGARVEIWSDTVLRHTLIERRPGDYTADAYPEAGVAYTLRVESEGFAPLSATDSIPVAAPHILDGAVDTSRIVAFFDAGYSLNPNYYLAEISFQDVEPGPGFFRVMGHYYDSAIYTIPRPDTSFLYEERKPVYFHTADGDVNLVSQPSQTYLLLPDVNFPQSTKTLQLYLSRFIFFSDPTGGVAIHTDTGEIDPIRNPRKFMEIHVEVRAMSETYYRFASSYLQQGFNTGDPFAIHHNVYSNVSGGKGIFAGFQSAWKQIL